MMKTLAKWTGAGYVLLAVMVSLMIWDLSNSNRPHELKMVTPALVLLAISSVIAVKLAMDLKKYWSLRKSVTWRLPRLMMVAATGMYVSVVALVVGALTFDFLF
jgi:hypothetical protein